MKNFKFSRLFAAAVFVAVLGLSGCKQIVTQFVDNYVIVTPIEANDPLIGEWANATYNTYSSANPPYNCKIATNRVETGSYGTHDGTVYIRRIDNTRGYIYYQFKSDVTGYESVAPYNSFTVSANGKWGAIAYQRLTNNNAVQMCDFADTTYEFPATLEACVTKYTVEGGYFSYLSSMDHTKN